MPNIAKALLKTLIPVRFRSRLRAFGLKYKCPFCNSHLRTFLPCGLDFPVLKEQKVVGGGYRENCRCPICDSFDRERLLYLYCFYKTDIFHKPIKLLHVAPELRIAEIFKAHTNIDYLTADLYSANAMVKMDVTAIQYSDSTFDVIICNHVLEHVIDDHLAMLELCRVLKPSGWAILQVPISLSLPGTYEDFSITTATGREEAFGQNDHVRIYANDYDIRLSRAGFKVNKFHWVSEAENFGGSRNLFGLNTEECVYLASKS